MKVVVLAGGFGSRLSEETTLRPKPLVEIGGKPIMWHIMKIYAHHGFNEFIVLGGYKVEAIRDYFLRYQSLGSDFTIDLGTGKVDWLQAQAENWRVTVLDTGRDTLTAARIKQARKFVDGERFCLTYGDGVSDVDIGRLLKFHESSDSYCTLTAVTQPGRYGALHIADDGHKILGFREKGTTDGGLINGGFFVCEPEVFDVLGDQNEMWEEGPMQRLVQQGKLASYHHTGYWQSMDSLRDKEVLEREWAKGDAAPWKKWRD